MNDLLNIKMPFNHEKNTQKPGPRNLKKNNKTTSAHIFKLIDDLENIISFYENNQRYVDNLLVDIVYNDIISKSGRIKEIFKEKGDCNNSIVGARFTDSDDGNENHIITHYISANNLKEAQNKLKVAANFLESEMNCEANYENFQYC